MRLGGWAKALEAAIDKNLGIDTEDANKTIEAANAIEGSLLDTDLAKQAKERFKGTTEKFGAVVGNVRDHVEKHVNRNAGGPKAVPSPDDFFSDFGFLDAKKTPAKAAAEKMSQNGTATAEKPAAPEPKTAPAAKASTPKASVLAQDITAAVSSASAKPAAASDGFKLFDDESIPPLKSRPSSQKQEQMKRQAEERGEDDADEQPAGAEEGSAWADANDLDDALLQSVAEQAAPVTEQRAPEQPVSSATEETEPDGGRGQRGLSAAEVEAEGVSVQDTHTRTTSTAAAAPPPPAAAAAATPPPASSGAARAEEDHAKEGAGAAVQQEQEQQEQQPEATKASPSPPPAQPSASPHVDAAPAARTHAHPEAQAHSRCSDPPAPQRATHSPAEGPSKVPGGAAAREEHARPTGEADADAEAKSAAGAGAAKGADVEELRMLREEVKQWQQAAQRWEAEAEGEREATRKSEAQAREREGEIEQLKGALAKSGQMLQDITLEGEERCQGLEYAVQQEKEARARLEAENATLRKASSSSTALQDRLKELEEEKQGLFKEGQRLMVEKQNLETGIKQCRKHIKEQEEQLTKLREQKTAEESKVRQLEDKLAAAGESQLSSEESIAQIRALSQETNKKLQAAEKEKSSLAVKVDFLERAGEEIQRERDEAERRAKKAETEAAEEAKRMLERERKGMQKDSSLQMEALSDALESAQSGLKRAEQQFAAKEQRLKQEIQDLTQRAAEAEERCQELSSAVPQSTRPLLRQLDNLQQSFAEKQKVWEQVEVSLRHRTSQAETEAREAAERERLAGEQAKQVQDAMGSVEARAKALQTEKARLGAELLAAKEELEEARRKEEEHAQQNASLKATATKRAQELADVKAMQRRMELEDKDRHEKEQEAWELEREELLGRISQLEAAAKQAERQGKQLGGGARGDKEWGDVDIFGAGNGSGAAGGLGALGVGGGGVDAIASAWDRHGAAQSVFATGAAGRTADSHVATLQQRVKALEGERDAVSEQLARVSVQKSRQEAELARLRDLAEQAPALRKQLELSLELLGAKEEEVDDLRETMEEQKQVFQEQLQALLPT